MTAPLRNSLENDGSERLHEIPEALGYAVTETGKVFSIQKQRFLTPKLKNGYFVIEYYVFGARKRKYLHRIIADLFIPRIEGKDCINHKDGIKTNNSICNLEWCTQSKNVKHAFLSGLCAHRSGIVGVESHRAKITEENVREIRKSNLSQRKLSVIYGIPPSSISLIKNRKSWKHVQ